MRATQCLHSSGYVLAGPPGWAQSRLCGTWHADRSGHWRPLPGCRCWRPLSGPGLRRGHQFSRALQRRSAMAEQVDTVAPIVWQEVKGILFDVDGTLVDSDELHFQAFVDLLQELNWEGDQLFTRHYFDTVIHGGSNAEITAHLFPAWSLVEQTAFSDRKEAYFRELASKGLKRLAGLTEFLQTIDDAGIRKIAVTNAPRLNAEQMLSAIGLSTYFEDVVIGEECPNAKPHPDPYLIGLKALGLDAASVIVFEDSPTGTEAGVAAGLRVVGLTTTQPGEVLLNKGACMVAVDFHEVMAALC